MTVSPILSLMDHFNEFLFYVIDVMQLSFLSQRGFLIIEIHFSLIYFSMLRL